MLASVASPVTPRVTPNTATSPISGLLPGRNAGSTGPMGGGLNLKSLLLYGTAGAILGVIFPVIPGGPIGGAIIGALLSLLG